MFASERSIGGITVRPGAIITQVISSQKLFGSTVRAGARCEGVDPDVWIPVVCLNHEADVVWEGPPEGDYDAADIVARAHATSRVRQTLVNIFS